MASLLKAGSLAHPSHAASSLSCRDSHSAGACRQQWGVSAPAAICPRQHPVVASQARREVARAATSRPQIGKSGGGGGAGLLERPNFDQSQLDGGPRTEEGGDIGLLKRMMRNRGGDKYRVLLLDHEKHTEMGVTKVLPRVVPNVTAEDARRAFYESKELGAGLVTLAIKEHAEFYAQQMARNGLRSTIAPDGDTV